MDIKNSKITWANLYEKFENDEINTAIRTLERIRMERDNIFVLVKASELAVTDEFLQYVPRTEKQANLKIAIMQGILAGYKDFWKPIVDPSFDAYGDGIRYEFGKKPAVGKNFEWWKDVADKFWPERKSRLGTKAEYISFLGVLLKELVASGVELEKAWYQVCDNSEELGMYFGVQGLEIAIGETGMFPVCGFYDFANTYKIVENAEEEKVFSFVGGAYDTNGMVSPLAQLGDRVCSTNAQERATGWIILEE